MYESPTGRAVRRSFETLAKDVRGFSRSDETTLRQRVSAAVDELKGLGWPVERIIIRLKEVAWESGLRLGHNEMYADRHPVIAEAVFWVVVRYYEKDRQGRDS